MANTKIPARLLDTSAIPALNVTGDLIVDTNTLKVDSTNNRVGIGATSPSYKLDISGTGDTVQYIANANPSGSQGRTLLLRDNYASSSQNSKISYAATSSPGQDVYLGKRTTSNAGYFHLTNSAGTEHLTVNMATGHVGIGETSPDNALHITGSGFNAAHIRVERTDSGSSNDSALVLKAAAGANANYGLGGIWFQNSLDNNAYALIRGRTDDSSGTSGRLDFITSTSLVDNNTAASMTIKSGGKVGIGTDNPYAQFAVFRNHTDPYSPSSFLDYPIMELKHPSTTGSYAGTRITNTDGNYEWFYGTEQTGSNVADFVFQGYNRTATQYQEMARISDQGYLGLAGQTSPGTPIHVGVSTSTGPRIQITHENSGGFGALDIDAYGSATLRVLSNFSGSAINGIPTGSFGVGTPHQYALHLNTNSESKVEVLATTKSMSNMHVKRGLAVGLGNQGDASLAGCRVVGWYNANAHSSYNYLHIVTSLWGGGSPHGNSQYIMGGWEITGHQYATNASHGKCNVFFHNWGGSVASGYSLSYTGAYTGWCNVYVNSSGYVTVRLNAGSYKGYWLDLYQAGHYTNRNISVTATTFSNSTTL